MTKNFSGHYKGKVETEVDKYVNFFILLLLETCGAATELGQIRTPLLPRVQRMNVSLNIFLFYNIKKSEINKSMR